MGRASISWAVPLAFFTAAMILSAELGPSGKALARRAPQDPSHPCPCVLDIHKLRAHAKGRNWNVSLPPETSTGTLVFEDPESFEDVQGDGGVMNFEVKLMIDLQAGPGPVLSVEFEKSSSVELKGGEDITCREPELHHSEYPNVTFEASNFAEFLLSFTPPFGVNDYRPNPNVGFKATCRAFGQTEGFDASGRQEICPDSLRDMRDIKWKNGKSNTIFRARK